MTGVLRSAVWTFFLCWSRDMFLSLSGGVKDHLQMLTLCWNIVDGCNLMSFFWVSASDTVGATHFRTTALPALLTVKSEVDLARALKRYGARFSSVPREPLRTTMTVDVANARLHHIYLLSYL